MAPGPSTHNSGQRVSSGAGQCRPSSSGNSTVSCKHYERNCNMVAPCCDRIVCCHRGHDESRHCRYKLDRSKVVTLICRSCKQRQPVGKACRSCSRLFGEKGCTICRMWYAGDGFHCKECGVCRQGREKDMVHCFSCKRCYPIRSGPYTHTCASQYGDGRCAGCGKDVHRSRTPSTTMRCGHSMHCVCFLQRVKTNYSCPIPSCRKTVANMKEWNKALDKMAAAEQRNDPGSAMKIYCYDCRGQSTIRSGGDLKKCKCCGSYNTVRIPPSQRNAPFVLPPSNMPRR